MSAVSLPMPRRKSASTRLYRAVWRWHFYAGLFVVPFLLVLATTGLVMVYGNSVETFLGPKEHVAIEGKRTWLEDQAAAAVRAVPGGTLKQMVHPADPGRATIFVVGANGKDHVVNVDPHGPKVIDTMVKDDTWFYWANAIHGTLLAGDLGDRLVETAAGLGILLVVSGLFMWFPRGFGLMRALVPDLRARGRAFFRQIHVTLGLYVSVVLIFFLLSGLAWTGVWGAKIVQAWSTFPAGKMDQIPHSDRTYASMNHGALKEVPWALEQAKLPVSGSKAGRAGVPAGEPVNLDTVSALAQAQGFDGQFRIDVPHSADGVYTISDDSMSGDTHDPTGDRTVHVDRYTGRVLQEIDFADYSLAGKAMAVGIALHQGNLGWWNTALNVLFCLSVITLCVSGIAIWWIRRPAGRLGAPLYPKGYRVPFAVIGVAVALAVVFPLTGIAIVGFAVVDALLPRRFKEAGFQAARA